MTLITRMILHGAATAAGLSHDKQHSDKRIRSFKHLNVWPGYVSDIALPLFKYLTAYMILYIHIIWRLSYFIQSLKLNDKLGLQNRILIIRKLIHYLLQYGNGIQVCHCVLPAK